VWRKFPFYAIERYKNGLYHNKDGKIYHLVYDYAWMEFSSQQILVVKKKFNLKQTQAVQTANRKLIL